MRYLGPGMESAKHELNSFFLSPFANKQNNYINNTQGYKTGMLLNPRLFI